MTDVLQLEARADQEAEIVGESAWLRWALALTDRVAPTTLSVLLQGPTGTGKELFARRLHARSGRSGRFMPVNCGALPREVSESLLFGHRKGAFTGAHDSVGGFIEAAHGGTLYLDELAGLPPDGQVKLLRVLESQEVYRVGETEGRTVDVRVVASVQEDVAALLARGALRLDLYQRVAGIVIELATLEERTEDILTLAAHFARLYTKALAPGAKAVLENYKWPGNVRELRMVIARAAFLAENGTLGPGDLTEAIELGAARSASSRASLGRPDAATSERVRLLRACQANGWDAQRVASALGIGRTTLFRRLRRAGISLRSAPKP